MAANPTIIEELDHRTLPTHNHSTRQTILRPVNFNSNHRAFLSSQPLLASIQATIQDCTKTEERTNHSTGRTITHNVRFVHST